MGQKQSQEQRYHSHSHGHGRPEDWYLPNSQKSSSPGSSTTGHYQGYRAPASSLTVNKNVSTTSFASSAPAHPRSPAYLHANQSSSSLSQWSPGRKNFPKKIVNIGKPTDIEHGIHVEYNPERRKFMGIPDVWQNEVPTDDPLDTTCISPHLVPTPRPLQEGKLQLQSHGYFDPIHYIFLYSHAMVSFSSSLDWAINNRTQHRMAVQCTTQGPCRHRCHRLRQGWAEGNNRKRK